jgi:hypothetical protein
MWYEVIMKKFGDNRNQTSEQEYAGLTLKELENQLVTEGPEGRIKNIVRVIIYWGRPLLALSLAAVLIWGAVYIISLKKEINELRSDLNTRAGSIKQLENAGQTQPLKETAPESESGSQSGEILQEENAGQVQEVEETEPDSLEEPPQEVPSEPDNDLDTQSSDIPQEENIEQDQVVEETEPVVPEGPPQKAPSEPDSKLSSQSSATSQVESAGQVQAVKTTTPVNP